MSSPVEYKRNMDVINQLLQEDALLREVSPILFLPDTDSWSVIAARTPDGCVRTGDALRTLLCLSAEDELFVRGWEGGARLVNSAIGIGILSMRWRFSAGIGLFLRLELSVPAMLSVIRAGAAPLSFAVSPSLTAVQGGCAGQSGTAEGMKDAKADVSQAAVDTTAEAMNRTVAVLSRLSDAMPRPDALGMTAVDRIVDWLAELSVAVGCVIDPLTVQRQTYWGQPLPDLPPATVCRWYAEPIWEAYLVTCLLLARQYAPTRMLSCTLSVGAEEDNCPVDVTLGFDVPVPIERESVPEPLRRKRYPADELLPVPPDAPVTLPPAITAGLDQLRLAAETYDAVLHWTAGDPQPSDKDEAVLFSVRTHMVFLSDPHREREGDVKVPPLVLRYE